MTLPEDDESVFEDLVDWLYRGRYDNPRRSDNVDIYLRPVQVFVLADKYGVPDLKSAALGHVFNLIKYEKASGPSLDTVVYAYRHTSQNAAIYKIFLDCMVWDCHHNWYRRAEHQEWLRAHPEIATNLIVRFAKHQETQKDPFGGEMPKEYMFEGSEEDTGGDKEPLSGS